MTFLLDTHLLVWLAADSRRVPRAARSLIEDRSNQFLFSAASLWEVGIKYALGRQFNVDPAVLRRSLLDHGYAELAVTSEHTLSLRGLPSLHKDPFDRLLIAQAIAEGITLLTVDATVASYPGPIRRV